MTDVTLYHGMASTCSKKVRTCLYEKEVAFESRLLDQQKFEQHTPEYLVIRAVQFSIQNRMDSMKSRPPSAAA